MARKHLNILVAGGSTWKEELEVPQDQVMQFGRSLGEEIMKQGHNLLSGCQTDLDKVVGEAAHAYLAKQREVGADDGRRIISYLFEGQQPIHNYGTVIQSDVPDWEIGGLEPTAPELIHYADVVILIGGFYGTYQAANWARLERKPLLPFATFGGAAKQVYKIESTRFDKIYAAKIDRIEYEQVLKAVSKDWNALVTQAINLAEKLVTTSSVYVIMSFAESGEYRDLYATVQRVCQKYEYEAQRVDEANLLRRIIPEITRQVRQSAFVIADVTEHKPNVFYELGFADGLGKEVILVAKTGTKLPFDIQDVPVLFWGDSFAEFEEELKKRVEQVGTWQGRA